MRRATTPLSAIPMVWISRLAQTALDWGRHGHLLPGHPSQLVKRNSQTVLNVAFNGLTDDVASAPTAAPMFWDLRVRSLEAQALEPLKAFEEMRGDAYPRTAPCRLRSRE